MTIVGNLTADPELRYTQAGAAVANFTVASTPRTFDKDSGQWRDGEALFLRCNVWREYAENVAASLAKGMQVIVQGDLVQRSYVPRDGGDKRTVVELQVVEVGPTLRWAKAQVERQRRDSSQATGWTSQPSYQAPADNPWGAPDSQSFDENPPF
jgi:single-strand DNA-binding protein